MCVVNPTRVLQMISHDEVVAETGRPLDPVVVPDLDELVNFLALA